MGAVFTIPPEVPFVDALARGLLDDAGDGDFSTSPGDGNARCPDPSGTIVLLPTRRACRALRDAFLRIARGDTLILPRIQPLGDLDPDELPGETALELDLPPAIGRIRRLLLLARLLAAHDPRMLLEHRFRLADELGALLDELASERRDLGGLQRLVPDHLTEHFQVTRRLLDLIHRSWPRIVAAEGALDPAERRNRALDAFARGLRSAPQRRVVAAGTTGSIDATRRLLRAIIELPGGAVVLPGLDLELGEATWQRLPASHPQAGLKLLLEALGRPRETVAVWPAVAAVGVDPSAGARRALVRAAMHPSGIERDEDEASLPPEVIARGGRSLEIMTHPDQGREAAALALRMRAMLEHPGQTAVLVTPDRALARRVRIELGRWDVEVDDSAGTPLGLTLPGTLLLLAARLIAGVTPVALLALLKHPLVRLGRTSDQLRQAVAGLERQALRGPRISGGFEGILTELHRLERELIARHPERAGWHERSIRLIEQLKAAARPFLELAGAATVDAAALADRHLAFAEALCIAADGRSALWTGEAGEAAADLFRELLQAAEDGAPLPPSGYPALIAQLMAERPVRSGEPRHPRLRIYGQLEARLQQADLVVLAGLNEGVWPPPTDPGPWLNRTMRQAIGLPPLERRIGLAAHDLQQLAAAPSVVLSRAERDAAGSPTVPSRWLVRLRALLDQAEERATPAPWAAWADRLAAPEAVPGPGPQPHPRPPVRARPRELSVSDVGLWMRDPYALYAKRILKLRPLAPLEQEPGALERGIMIHGILERFVAECPDHLPADAWARIVRLGRQAFEVYAHRPLVRALWWPRFERAARWYLDREQERRSEIAKLHVEVVGWMPIERPAGRFLLNARADRIERGSGGELTIIDYKTGALPKTSDVTSGRQPQLPLEALMVGAGAFADMPPQPVEGLWFWSLRGDSIGGQSRKVQGSAEELARAALDGLCALIDHYDDPSTGYPARLRPDMTFARDYDHLARFKEWAG